MMNLMNLKYTHVYKFNVERNMSSVNKIMK
jgi:hypothetical protein